jgi:hypothetical protein
VLVASGPSSFFLPEKIFHNIEAHLSPPPPPRPTKWSRPRLGLDGAAQLLQFAGGAQGSDCLKASSARCIL